MPQVNGIFGYWKPEDQGTLGRINESLEKASLALYEGATNGNLTLSQALMELEEAQSAILAAALRLNTFIVKHNQRGI